MVAFDRWYQSVAHAPSAYARACCRAFGPDQFIGQNGFSRRDEILELAASVVRCAGARVLDVCCGSGGPGRLLAQALGCTVVGIDNSLGAAQQARCGGAVVGDAQSLPFATQSFDAAVVLDSIASIACVHQLFREAARVLRPGGWLGYTAEVGQPLSALERAQFTRTHPPTVLEVCQMTSMLEQSGFEVMQVEDRTTRTATTARRLFETLRADRELLAGELGAEPIDDLVATLGTLADMLTRGRLREVAVVAQRVASATSC